jgi:hypothetical protein
MAAKAPTFDLWLVELNKVYRGVPFAVVCDWAQQGRLLEDDRARPAGTEDWRRVGDMPALAVYLPRPEPHQPEDVAEALEPVEVPVRWKPKAHDDEDEVDMIPLIDVSLVLLIFFMMSAAVAGAGGFRFPGLPAAEYGDLDKYPTKAWIGIDRTEGGGYRYSVGLDGRPAAPNDRDLGDRFEAVRHLKALLDENKGPPVDVTINARDDIPAGRVRDLTALLERAPDPKRRDDLLDPLDIHERIANKYTGVSGK